MSSSSISDAHEGIKAAVSKVLCATWQRCRVHFMRNVLAHAGKSGRRVASAFIATAFAQETPEAASIQWRAVADQIRPKVPKFATIMDDAEPAGLHDLPRGDRKSRSTILSRTPRVRRLRKRPNEPRMRAAASLAATTNSKIRAKPAKKSCRKVP